MKLITFASFKGGSGKTTSVMGICSTFVARGMKVALIDTRGGGSELNNASVVNTNAIIIPSALTTLDITAALTTFEHTVQLLQNMKLDLPVSLLIQRVPAGKLTVSQRDDLVRLSDLPRYETIMHARDAFAAIGKRGLLHKIHAQFIKNPMKSSETISVIKLPRWLF